MIRRFTAEGHRFRLIVSLGAPSSGQRLPLMPIEKRWPLPELMDGDARPTRRRPAIA